LIARAAVEIPDRPFSPVKDSRRHQLDETGIRVEVGGKVGGRSDRGGGPAGLIIERAVGLAVEAVDEADRAGRHKCSKTTRIGPNDTR
jgi:hypothetical protein